MATDVSLTDEKGYYDFSWTESGDISTEQSLDTAILMSIFNEVRASSAEVPESNARRGWLGNQSTPGFEQGSKQWLFGQERLTGSVLAELGPVVRNGLQWLIDDGIAVSVEVGNARIINGAVTIEVLLGRSGSVVEKKVYELWENTFK
ncbi:MAG: phage GP46 family protein [candidate division Zixibacteria bacterium]|nr:phage GP46 family protein [candidate division Zixibacteria bacterium]